MKGDTVDSGANGFRPVEVVAEPVNKVTREAARSGYRVYRAADGFEAAVAEQVIERALAMGKKAAPNEWYGILVGRLCQDQCGSHVVVLGLVPDPEVIAATGFVETTLASEYRTRGLARLLFPDAIILGWIHGHVGHGARYSLTDRKNQATWTQSHAIGIVVDPFSQAEVAVYRGPDAELLTEATDEAPDTERTPTPAPPAERPTEKRPAPAPSAAAPAGSKLLKAGVIVSMAMAIGCFVVVVMQSRRVARLETRVSTAEAERQHMAVMVDAILDALPNGACEDDEGLPQAAGSSAEPLKL